MLTGASDVIRKLIAVQRAARDSSIRRAQKASEELLEIVKQRTDHAFQEVPSYLQWNNRFPKGTVATFSAEKAPSVAGTPWEKQVQKSPDPVHALNRMLTATPATYSSVFSLVSANVGYPEEVPGDNLAYIYYVMFGTPRMQPRPFLELSLLDVSGEFAASMATIGPELHNAAGSGS